MTQSGHLPGLGCRQISARRKFSPPATRQSRCACICLRKTWRRGASRAARIRMESGIT